MSEEDQVEAERVRGVMLQAVQRHRETRAATLHLVADECERRIAVLVSTPPPTHAARCARSLSGRVAKPRIALLEQKPRDAVETEE